MTPKELVRIILQHRDFLNGKLGGARANLSHQDLSGLKLPNINVEHATLAGAKFRGSVLSGANFRFADLFGCDFSDSDVSGACFDRADMRGVKFRGANLNGASLADADLRPGGIAELPREVSRGESQRRLAGGCGSAAWWHRGNVENARKF